MWVVLDTNVLLSAILFKGLPRSLLESALRGEIDLVTSPTLLTELEELLHRKFDFTSELARATRMEMESLADDVTPTEVPHVARDPDDDEVLAAAVGGGSETIVTGDRDLLSLGTHEGIRILTPAEFAELTGRAG